MQVKYLEPENEEKLNFFTGAARVHSELIWVGLY